MKYTEIDNTPSGKTGGSLNLVSTVIKTNGPWANNIECVNIKQITDCFFHLK